MVVNNPTVKLPKESKVHGLGVQVTDAKESDNGVTLQFEVRTEIKLWERPRARVALVLKDGRRVKYKRMRAIGGVCTAEFYDVQVWGGWAENFCKSARKGSLVLVEGRVLQERWTDEATGKGRSRMKVRARKVFDLRASRQAGQESAREELEAEVVPEGKDVPF